MQIIFLHIYFDYTF